MARSARKMQQLRAERQTALPVSYTHLLASRPGLGHFIDETEEKRVILLANLLRKDPFLIPLAGITRDNLQPVSYTHLDVYKRQRIDSIGIDTWGVDFVLLDQQGQRVGLPVAYRDSRSNGLMAQAQQQLGKRDIYQRSGCLLYTSHPAFEQDA